MNSVNDGAFFAAYNRLNSAQKKAVDTIEGPVMVIAGPGTGKTQILTLRIANILRTQTIAPENILALTFTKSGAKAMRERLLAFIGVTAYRVPIYTFHGLCERLIRDYPEAFEKLIGSKPATEIEKITFIERVLERPELSLLRPHGDPSFYVKPILSIISNMKQENVSPDTLATIVEAETQKLADIPQYHEKGAYKGKERGEYTKAVSRLEKMQALLTVYRLYESLMRVEKRYDFDDMILESVMVLSTREDIRLDLQETYQYILADEHQDVNGAQNAILNHLTSFHSSPNIFVVGDEKQAVYRFQGASLENFLYFVEHYKGAQLITLDNNYRSTNNILVAGQNLVTVSEDSPLAPYRTSLLSNNGEGELPVLEVYPHEGYEDAAVVDRVRTAIKEGVEPSEIAVIVRSNREVETLTTLLRRAGVSVRPSADSDVLKHPLFVAVLDLFEVILQPQDETLLARVMMAPYWNIELADLAALMQQTSYDLPLSKLLFSLPDTISWQSSAQIKHIAETIKRLRSEVLIAAPHRFAAEAVTMSGLLRYAATADPLGSTQVIRRIYDEIEALVIGGEVSTLSDVVTLFRQRIAYGVALNAPLLSDSANAIEVMTAHKSKGLEFEIVFVPHLTENTWGVNKRPDYFKVPLLKTASLEYDALEDERRLLYVAMTRAKSKLYLSYSEKSADGKEHVPSPLLVTQAVPTTVATADLQLPSLVVVHCDTNLKSIFVPIIEKTLRERGLSATTLNNCIKNPWHYLYRNVIRLPEVQSPSMQFGTAMHSVLEMATRYFTSTGTLPSFSIAHQKLAEALGRLPLATVEFTNLLARGDEVLSLYLPHLQTTLVNSTKEELSLRVLLNTGLQSLPEITLTGKLDRIDIGPDGRATKVVDYKTGKAKTRNDIEGKTAKNDSSYRRQLSFYSLLLNLHDDERYITDVGELSFIEADNKGRIHDENYESGTAERDDLKDEIKQVVEMLLAGDFLDNETLLMESDYADFGQRLLELARQKERP